MGVTDVKRLLKATDLEQLFFKEQDIPETGSVATDDLPVRAHKIAPSGEELTWTAYIDRFVKPYRNYGQKQDARILWILNDYKTVTKRKKETQMKRTDARKKSGTEPYPLGCICTRRGLLDVKTQKYYDVIEPDRIALSRHLRDSLADVIQEVLTNEVVFPPHLFVFFDSRVGEPVQMLHRGTVTPVAAAADTSAEAESRAVHRMMQTIGDYPDGMVRCGELEPVPLSIVLRTVDTDTLPVALKQLWNLRLPECVSISALLEKALYIDLKKMVEVMRARGWSADMFIVACALLGTDYTSKNDYLWMIGHSVAWQAWDACAAEIVASVDPARPGYIFELMQLLVATASVAKVKGTGVESKLYSWDAAIAVVANAKDTRLRAGMLFDKKKEIEGKANLAWVWQYWASCGHDTGDEATHGQKPVLAAALADHPGGQFSGGRRGGGGGHTGWKPPAAEAAAAAAPALHRVPTWMEKWAAVRQAPQQPATGPPRAPAAAAAASAAETDAPNQDDFDDFAMEFA